MVVKRKNKNNLDPDLAGDWKQLNTNVYLRFMESDTHPDGFLFGGRLNVDIELLENGQILHTNHPPYETFHERIAGNPQSFVGIWILKDEQGNMMEEYHLREDGRYLSLWGTDDPVSYTGFYEIADNKISACELHYRIFQKVNCLKLSGLTMPSDTAIYFIENGKLHLKYTDFDYLIFEKMAPK